MQYIFINCQAKWNSGAWDACELRRNVWNNSAHSPVYTYEYLRTLINFIVMRDHLSRYRGRMRQHSCFDSGKIARHAHSLGRTRNISTTKNQLHWRRCECETFQIVSWCSEALGQRGTRPLCVERDSEIQRFIYRYATRVKNDETKIEKP